MIKALNLQAQPNSYDGAPLKPRFVLDVTLPAGRIPRFGNGFVTALWSDTIITAAHVVEDAVQVRATTWIAKTGKTQWFDCVGGAYDEDSDLAVLQLPRPIQVSRELSIVPPPDHGSIALRAYRNLDAWKHQRVLWKPTAANRVGKWLFYPSRYGDEGTSGGAVILAGTEDAVVGVQRGPLRRDGLTRFAAAVCDVPALQRCRTGMTGRGPEQ